MNIALTTSASMKGAGGDGRVARELAEVLSREHNVLLILSGKSTKKSKAAKNLQVLEIAGTPKGDVFLPSPNPVKYKALINTLREFAPDVIHFHDQNPYSFVSLLWSLKHKVPTIFTSHTIPSEIVSFGLVELFPQIHKLFDSKVYSGYFDLFLKKSSALVAINDVVRKDLAAYSFDTPVYEIPNARNLADYSQCSFASLDTFPKRLIFIGYLTHRKNQAFLIELMHYLPKAEYVLDLVGISLDGEYGNVLQRKAEHAKLPVKFLGKVPHEDIPALLARAHFFVSASTMEVQSLAVLEALASGTPVVSLNNETTSEFIDEATGFNFTEEVSPEVFAAKVEELANLPQTEYEKLCQMCQERVSHLDWSTIAKQTVEMYEEIIEKSKDSPRRLGRLRKLLKAIDISI